MKHPIKFLCFITLLLLGTITCSAQKNAADYLKNQTQRKAMYQAILTNNQYRQELMQEMMQHHKGMGKMQGDSSHMAMMHQMMQMGEQDTVMAGQMCSAMMSNKTMMKQMMQKMKDKGMMSNECMMQAMQQMNKEEEKQK